MVAVPPAEAYCVRLPEPMLKDRFPSVWLPTATSGMVMAGTPGLTSAPDGPNVKLVPAFVQATWVPVAPGLD